MLSKVALVCGATVRPEKGLAFKAGVMEQKPEIVRFGFLTVSPKRTVGKISMEQTKGTEYRDLHKKNNLKYAQIYTARSFYIKKA